MKGKFALPSRKLREIELQTNAGWIEWRYIGDTEWTQLFEIPADGIDGDDGREVELQTSGGFVQWRYVGDVSWTNLFQVPQDGNDGLSAYEIAVNNGFVGTEAEWLASLQGSDGSVDLGSSIKLGALYNTYVIADARNIANDGWRIPSNSEFDGVRTYLGGWDVAGGVLKETGTVYWDSPNTGASNAVNFNARGAGVRIKGQGYIQQGLNTEYWTTTFNLRYTISNSTAWLMQANSENAGASIRLVRDAYAQELSLPDGAECEPYFGNNGREYRTVKIDSLVVMSENLFETKYRNGDWITGYDGGIYTPISDAIWDELTSEAMCIYFDDEANASEASSSTFSEAIIDHETRIQDLEQCCEEVVTPEQSDWNEADPQSLAFIKNKPTITSNGDKNLDGGTWDSVYLPTQTVNGGGW